MIDIPILRFSCICKAEMQNRGIINIAMSDVMLINEEAIRSAEILTQCPGV